MILSQQKGEGAMLSLGEFILLFTEADVEIKESVSEVLTEFQPQPEFEGQTLDTVCIT